MENRDFRELMSSMLRIEGALNELKESTFRMMSMTHIALFLVALLFILDLLLIGII